MHRIVDNSYGHTYGAHQEFWSLMQQHAELKPTASQWDWFTRLRFGMQHLQKKSFITS
jgi:hypothetical protein